MKKILVGIDNSPRTPDVLAAAASLAKQSGAKLVLFRAVTIPTDPEPTDYTIAPADYGTVLEGRGRAQVEGVAKTLPEGLVERIHVQIGVPWEAICEAAKADDVDCIVIGSHGYAVIDRLLGTTAAKVVNHADRSVIVVRDAKRLQS